ncbi:protein PLANT CADMIUM RESISTANCE 6-like [Humulus lupulus]|uniref:protein PLANT CADMIUM RESISTANCE 6-like n=1 Tax=Humulus lupulus TaxID=3486 RepID=UPI002B413DD1|nr:protein PLANT CADMIUM RESISTANCE 6-like [Humulus lupulus]
MEDPFHKEAEQSHLQSELDHNASSYDQHQQQTPPNTTANNGPPDQLPAQPSEPQRSVPEQPIQYQFQANYQTQPQPQQNPQANFMSQNGPNQSPQPQYYQPQMVQVPPAQYQHQVHQYQQQPNPMYQNQYQQQPNPVYQNGAHQPITYTQSPQTVYPPPVQNNMGPPPGVSQQPLAAASQTAPSPVKFHQENGGAAAFGGGMPGNYPNGAAAQQNGAAAQGFPMHNQFQTPQPSYGQQGGWSTGLFDCMDDPMNAAITAICPCVTFGQVAEIVDNGTTSCSTSGLMYGLVAFFIGIPCIMSCTYRTKLRNKFGLLETPAPDWVTHFLCDCCAICQEYRELQIRGFDPSIGWQGNLAKMQGNQHQQQMMPPMNQRMMS